MGRLSLTIFDLFHLAGQAICGVARLETLVDGFQSPIAELRVDGPGRPTLLFLDEPGALNGHGNIVAQQASAVHIAIVECVVFRSVRRCTPVPIADLEESIIP